MQAVVLLKLLLTVCEVIITPFDGIEFQLVSPSPGPSHRSRIDQLIASGKSEKRGEVSLVKDTVDR